MKEFFLGEMDNSPCQTIFSFFLFEFLSRTLMIRTFEAENLQKNKHIQPQPNLRCSYKKKRFDKKKCTHGFCVTEWAATVDKMSLNQF